MKKHNKYNMFIRLCRIALLTALSTIIGACGHASSDELRQVIQQAEAHGAKIYARSDLELARQGLAKATRNSQEKAQDNLIDEAMKSAKTALGRATRLSQRAKVLAQRTRKAHDDKRQAVEDATNSMRKSNKPTQLLLGISLPSGAHLINDEILFKRLQAGDNLILVDLRDRHRFAKGHIVGALNASAESVAYRRFAKDLDLVVYGDANSQALVNRGLLALASQRPQRLYVLHGGFDRWKLQGRPWAQENQQEAEGPGLIQAKQLAQLRKRANDEIILIDIRPATGFLAGHIPGAQNSALATLDATQLALKKTVIVYGGDDVSAYIAAQRIAESNHVKVRYLAGGTRAWALAGYTLEASSIDKPDDIQTRPAQLKRGEP